MFLTLLISTVLLLSLAAATNVGFTRIRYFQVAWAQSRYEDIQEQLKPFLTQSGFHPSKVFFVPVGATSGENLVERTNPILESWYAGPTLVEQLGMSAFEFNSCKVYQLRSRAGVQITLMCRCELSTHRCGYQCRMFSGVKVPSLLVSPSLDVLKVALCRLVIDWLFFQATRAGLFDVG